MWEFRRELFQQTSRSSGFSIDWDNTDDHSANDLLHAACHAADTEQLPDLVKARVACFSHKTQHTVVGVTVSVFSVATISELAAATSFFGMGTHMLRLVLHVPILLRQEGLVTVAACKPDASELCFAAEYKDIVLANFEGTKKQRLNLSNRLDGLFSRWTGCYFERGRIMSTYDPPNMDNFLKELECCYIDVVLPCNPARPSMGKWTPLFLCVWWFGTSLLGGLVSMLLESALGALKGSDATILEQMKEATEGFQLDIAWSHVATSKRRVAEGRYRDQTWCVRISIMWVLYEGLWILARYYMVARLQTRTGQTTTGQN